MKPFTAEPAGTAAHRQHFAEVARRAAFKLAWSLGSGELDGECYRLLSVGHTRCQEALDQFVGTVEQKALALFDAAVDADAPEQPNVVTLLRKTR